MSEILKPLKKLSVVYYRFKNSRLSPRVFKPDDTWTTHPELIPSLPSGSSFDSFTHPPLEVVEVNNRRKF